MMAEAGAEQASLELHPSEPDCFGSTVTSYSEGSAAMDMCVKTEPVDEEISQPAYCTEVQGFSAEEIDSGLHLDADHIKTEIVMVKITEDSVDLQLCSDTEELCPPSSQFNSSTGLLFKQCNSDRGEVELEQHSQLQESSCTEDINEACDIKEEYVDIQVNELSSSHCPSPCQQQYGPSRKTYSRGDELNQHKFIHSGDKICTQSESEKCFSQGGSLQVLQLVSSVKQFEHNPCGRKTSCEMYLKNQEFIQSADKPYKCDQCGKCFSRGNNLKRHQLLHSGEKPHQCIECGKSFSQQGYLKQHQLIHSGEKPYTCNECGRSFFQANHLKHHQLIHSGEKPHECSQCGKSFSRSYHLKQHQLVHSGEKPFKCGACGKSFSRINHLERHHRTHSGEKPFKCNDCGKSFALRQYLKKHETAH